jgi:hypothetical protein
MQSICKRVTKYKSKVGVPTYLVSMISTMYLIEHILYFLITAETDDE